MKNILGACLLALLMCLCACAGQLSSLRMGPTEKNALIFPISTDMADRLVELAMVQRCPTYIITRIELPKKGKGYQVTIRFGFDTHTIAASYIPARGRNEAGEMVDGVIFEVMHSGTMARGVAYANDIYESVIENATRMAKPIPFVEYEQGGVIK